ncbi:MAG: amidohydrolase family protein [Pseudomonadota bacterium]
MTRAEPSLPIDAHQHFWRLARGDYGWLTPAQGPIYRDFGPEDLRPHLRRAGIGGTVLVQAAPSEAETRYLLALAAHSKGLVKGVVGWVDMEAPDADRRLERLAADKLLRGIRPMIQDIAELDWMLDARLDRAWRALIALGLTFDAQVRPPHLPNLARLLARYPDLEAVIDHGAKPHIAAGAFEPWASNIAALARGTKAWCKLSGLVTEAAADWRVVDLRRYGDHLIDCFGPQRLMWGSDWPVVELAGGYERWWEATLDLLDGLGDADRRRVLGENAAAFYGLAASPPGPQGH